MDPNYSLHTRPSNAIVPKNHKDYFYIIFKRAIDIILSIFAIIICSPIVAITAIFIKLDSKGPVFYKQQRIGINGKPFILLKLRSMNQDAEKDGAKWAEKNDDRITRVGRIIRKTRIDELPQLLNVLKGDMSIVGPRPERKVFIDEFSKQIPEFNNRLLVKPGLTGWAQVNGGYDLKPQEKIIYDCYYIKNRSLMLDIKCMIKTIKVILTQSGAR